jgi:hypothetical protein
MCCRLTKLKRKHLFRLILSCCPFGLSKPNSLDHAIIFLHPINEDSREMFGNFMEQVVPYFGEKIIWKNINFASPISLRREVQKDSKKHYHMWVNILPLMFRLTRTLVSEIMFQKKLTVKIFVWIYSNLGLFTKIFRVWLLTVLRLVIWQCRSSQHLLSFSLSTLYSQ